MLDRLLSNPLVALGFIIAVVYLALFYLAQRERSQVNQMRGQRRFSPKWSSGRRHYRRRGAARREGFSPQWNRKKARRKAETPPPSPEKKPLEADREPPRREKDPGT